MSKLSDYINDLSENKNNYQEKLKEENYEEMISKYSKLSSSELISEFLRLTSEKKKQGALSDNEMESIINTLSPYLDNEQRENLNNLMSMVKNVK